MHAFVDLILIKSVFELCQPLKDLQVRQPEKYRSQPTTDDKWPVPLHSSGALVGILNTFVVKNIPNVLSKHFIAWIKVC